MEHAETPFARALRRAITEQDWSNRAAGEALGVSHTQIGRYLVGATPSLTTARRLAEHLGVTLDQLAGREPQRDRSLELAEQIREASEPLATIADALLGIAHDVSRLGGRADGAAGTG